MGSAVFAEHDVRKVVRNLEVMIREGVVLFGIENFEQRGRWIASEVVTDLVDLIHHEDGVDHAGLLHALDDLSWQCTDVGSSMSTNGRFVMHTAQ
jgi:hypothetical protein